MRRIVLFLLTVSIFASAAGSEGDSAAAPLKEVQRISLPIDGRIDHFNIDLKGHRLFLAALGNGSVEAVDLRAGKWLSSLPGFQKPQGIWYSERLNKLFIASGNDGTCKVFDGKTLKLKDTLKLDLGPDAVAYNPHTGFLYIGYGGEDANKDFGSIAIIDPKSDKHVGDIRVEAHPGAILPDHSGKYIYITIPKADKVGVIDADTKQIRSLWSTEEAKHPVALALDETNKRLFVANRAPAMVIVYDLSTHKTVTVFPIVGLVDGIFYDSALHRIYVSGGAGAISVYQQRDADHYEEISNIPTGPVARTSLLVPQLHRYYVAIPKNGDHAAEIRVFETTP